MKKPLAFIAAVCLVCSASLFAGNSGKHHNHQQKCHQQCKTQHPDVKSAAHNTCMNNCLKNIRK